MFVLVYTSFKCYHGYYFQQQKQIVHSSYSFVMQCRQAGVGGQMKVGSGLGHDERRTRPADVLVSNWDLQLLISLLHHCLNKASSMKRV